MFEFQMILLTASIVITISLIVALGAYFSQGVSRGLIATMNRKIVEYDLHGWVVLIDVKRRIVGLYSDQIAVSHAHIHIGKIAMKTISEMTPDSKFTIADFRKYDIEIPRFSYRVLYEYSVPQDTPVILY